LHTLLLLIPFSISFSFFWASDTDFNSDSNLISCSRFCPCDLKISFAISKAFLSTWYDSCSLEFSFSNSILDRQTYQDRLCYPARSWPQPNEATCITGIHPPRTEPLHHRFIRNRKEFPYHSHRVTKLARKAYAHTMLMPRNLWVYSK